MREQCFPLNPIMGACMCPSHKSLQFLLNISTRASIFHLLSLITRASMHKPYNSLGSLLNPRSVIHLKALQPHNTCRNIIFFPTSATKRAGTQNFSILSPHIARIWSLRSRMCRVGMFAYSRGWNAILGSVNRRVV